MGLLDMLTSGNSRTGGGGLLDFIMPGPSQNPYPGMIHDSAWDQYRRNQLGKNLRNTGDFLMRAAGGNFSGGGKQRGPGLLEMMELENKRREEQNLRGQKAAQQALGSPGRYDPNKGILWDTAPPGADHGPSGAQTRGLLDTEREGLLSQAWPKAYGNAKMAQFLPKPAGVPTGFERTSGGLSPIAGGPADPGYLERAAAAKGSGGLTQTQLAHNAEIAQARATLERRGYDRAEITRLTQKALNTGRDNPEYEEGLDRIVRMATDRMVGDDPDYRLFHNRYLGPAPEFSDPAGMRQLPPGVSTEQPGIFQRGYNALFGSDSQPASQANPLIPPNKPPLPGTATAQPTGLRGRRRQSRSAKPISTMTYDEAVALINGDRELSQAELNRLDARLKQLGR